MEREFPSVSVPSMLSQDPAQYTLEHFWDAFFDDSEPWRCDSSFILGVPRQDVEMNLAMFARIISRQSVEAGDAAMRSLWGKVEAFRADSLQTAVSDTLIALVEKYFYDPSSPVHSEDAFYEFARGLASSPIVKESMKDYWRTAEHNCSLNRRGTKAADFVFKDKEGRARHLYDVKARYTLVKIQNLECTACRDLQQAMEASPKICYLLSKGVVAQIDVPAEGDIEKVYDVRAIPSLYILDEDKTVLAKDAEMASVLDFLENINEQAI